MFCTRISGHPGGKNPVLIGIVFLYGNNTVRGHQDWTIERFEFLILLPPGTPVVPSKMIILLECRIVICRQHLTMSIDVYASPFRLFQKFFHIFEVVAADKDSRIVSNTKVNFSHFRISIGRGICLIKKGHCINGKISCFHDKSHHFIHRQIFGGGCQSLHQESVNILFFKSQDCRVICVGSNTFHPNDQQLSKGTNIFILCGKNANFFCLLVEF